MKKKDALLTPPRQSSGGLTSNITDSSVGPSKKYRSVFQEAEEFLIQCHLIFLYADLRLLSATGRLNTKFETLYIESDKVKKTHSSRLSGTGDAMQTDHLLGISAAQIMAILLIELRKEVQNKRKEVQKRKEAKGKKSKEGGEESFFCKMTDSSSRKKHEGDMASRLQFYNQMIGKDMKKKIEPHVISPERLSLGPQPATELSSRSSRFRLAPQSMKRKHSMNNMNGYDDLSSNGIVSNAEDDNLHPNRILSKENDTPADAPGMSKLFQNFLKSMNRKELDHPDQDSSVDDRSKTKHYHEKGSQNSWLYHHFMSMIKKEHDHTDQDSSVDGKIRKVFQEHSMQQKMTQAFQRLQHGQEADEFFLSQEAQDVGDAFFDLAKEGIVDKVDKAMTEDEVLDMIQKAVDSRLDHSLDFMSGFFKEGSMCEAMFKSTANVFWINDWYPLIDCTYAIAVDPGEKRVLVVFRGAITTADWKHTRDFYFCHGPNPIEEDFEGKKQYVTFHSGFYNYIFRKRKDTNTTKYDEIVNKVVELASMLGEDSEIVVTGFSLGAALAVIFGFYGSVDPRLTKKGPIKMYTYGSPYVGGPSFCKSFQHQERNKKITYANIYNPDDSVTHLPFNIKGNFQHVGIRLRLPILRRPLRRRILGQARPKVSYTQNFEPIPRYIRAMRQSIFLNCIFPWEIRKKHALDMHHKRMVYFEESHIADILTEKSIEDLYQEMVLS